MGIFDWKHWLVLLIVLVLFGRKRLKSLGAELGESLKGFRRALATESEASASAELPPPAVESEVDQKARTANSPRK